MADEDRTITIKFRGDDTEIKDTVSNIDKAIKVLQVDTSALQKQLKFGDDYDQQMHLYSQAISNVSEAIRLAEQNLSSWQDEVTKFQDKAHLEPLTDKEMNKFLTAQKMVSEYEKKIANLVAQEQRLIFEEENYNRLSIAQKLDTQGERLKKLGGNINKVAEGFKYMSLAAGAALTGSALAATNFETAMANVKKVLRTEDETYFSTLQQQILDMSRELPLTAQEIAQVTANALQLGVSAKDVGLFTETILKLGSSTNIAADEAAIALAQFFNITGESLGNVDKFGAVLTDLGNKFPTFESDIMDMATRIAAAGTSIGMSSQDILGLSTALTSVGLNAEAGGSAISTILRTIDTQVATSGKKLSAWAKQAGMSVDEFKRAWRQDATGTFQLLVNSLAAGVDNGENLNAMLKDLGVTAIRQTDAFSRLVQANDTLNDALKQSGVAWEEVAKGAEGALNEEFANRVNTLAAQFQLLKNDIFALGVAIGENLMPYMRALVERARELMNWFLNLSPTTKKWITAMLGGLAAIYPVLKTIGTRISSIGTLLLGVAGIAKSGLLPSDLGGAAFSGLISSMKAFGRSVAVPVAVIGALVAAFVSLYKNNETFANAIDRLTNAFKFGMAAATTHLLTVLKDFATWFEAKLVPLFEYLKELYRSYIEPTLSYLFTAITKLVYDAIITLYNWVVKVIDIVIDFLKPAINMILKLLELVAGVLAPIIGIITRILGVIVEVINYLWDKAKPYVETFLNGVAEWVNWFAERVEYYLAPVYEAIRLGLDMLGEAFAYLRDTGVIASFGQAFQNIIEPIKTVFEWVKKVVDKINEWAGKAPTINEMVSDAGYRYSGTTVYNTNNITQRNTVNGVNSGTAQRLADDVLSLVNNGIGKQLDTRGW